MRDRLIELISSTPYTTVEPVALNELADHLIANGVIVPPCKVGDTVYLLRENTHKIIEGIVTAITKRHTFQYAEVFIEDDKRKTIICLSYWGERLFQTKEEAKAALKGGAE